MEADSLQSWVTLLFCVYINLVSSGYVYAIGSIYVLIQESYSITRAEASVAINFMTSTFFLCAIIAGPACYFLNMRKVLTIGIFIQVIGCGFCYASPVGHSTSLLCLGMAFRGIGMSVVRPITMQCISSLFIKHKAKALMLMFFTNSVACVVLPFVDNAATQLFGLRGMWLITAAITAQSLVFASITNFNTEAPMKEPEPDKSTKSFASFHETILSIIKNPVFYVITFGLTCNTISALLLKMIIMDFSRDTHTMENISMTLLSIISIGEIIGRLISSTLLDKKIFNYGTTLWTSFLLMAVSFVVFPFTEDFTLAVNSLAFGIVYSTTITAIIPQFSVIGTNTVAISYGVTVFILGLIQIGIPRLIGYFRDEGGSYNTLLFMVGGWISLTSLILFESHRRKQI